LILRRQNEYNIFERNFKGLLDHKKFGELYKNDVAAFNLLSENPRTID
jgi:hypothetical protein